MPFDRRKLLQWMPAGLAAMLLPKTVAAEEEPGSPSEPALDGSFDVAIVGGGVAGCYVAYRLLHGELVPGSPLAALAAANGGKLSVGLFESSGRVGGRLLSAEIPQLGNPDLGIGEGPGNPDTAARKYAEFGGFRFQPQMHIVRDLAKLLHLDHEPFPVDEPPQNPVYLRRKRFLRGELAAAAKNGELPYDLTPEERATIAGGGDFDTFVANRAFAGTLPDGPAGTYGPAPNGYSSLRTRYQQAFQAADWVTVAALRDEWETAKQVAEVDGRRIPDWSWWALSTRFLSSEAIAYSEDSGGYNSLWSPGNVPANLDEDFYFAAPSDVYPSIYGTGTLQQQIEAACTETAWKHVVSGYSDIPNRLYQGFTAKGGQGFLQHQLLDFHGDGAGGYVLRFFQRESGTLTTAQAQERCRQDPASCRTYGAKHVILALPKRSLELLDQRSSFFTDPTVQQLLRSVLDVPAMRFFLAYERPWWTEAMTHRDGDTTIPAPTCGRSTTDLRVRQLYYWHTASDGGLSFVLGSYTNGQANFYWRELQNGPGPFDRLPGAAPPLAPPRFDAAQGKGPRAASDDMARFAHRDLVEVVGPLADGKTPPEPHYAHFQDWDKDPWGAGWHAFTAGHDAHDLIPRILQPLPGEKVYVCGESYSNVQGWVQGALNTSEVLLQKKLGLAYPSWLTPGGTWLGPGSEGIPTT
jgi:lysine 2-monooxygenase